MGSIRHKPNGRYEARWRDPLGRLRGQTFDTKGDAQRFLARTSADVQRGRWIDPALSRMTFDEWLDGWWPAASAALGRTTVARDEANLRNHVRPHLGGSRLDAMDYAAISRWVGDLTAKGLAPATVAKIFQVAHKALDAAVTARVLPHNPATGVPLPRQERTEMRFLTPEEVARLAEVIHPRFRALVLVGAYGGLRYGELAGLRRPNLDPLRGRITIVEAMTEVAGDLQLGPPKTPNSRRNLLLPKSITAELQEHLTSFPPADDQFVFTSPEGLWLRRSNFYRRQWLPAVKAARLAPLRIHDLRHTAVSFWIAAGANPSEIAARAGHSSVSVVLDRYGHLLPGADERLAENLEALYPARHTSTGPRS